MLDLKPYRQLYAGEHDDLHAQLFKSIFFRCGAKCKPGDFVYLADDIA